MKSKSLGGSFLPIAVIFVATSLLFAAAHDWLAGKHIDHRVLLAGNLILFLATALSFYLYSRTLRNSNVHSFLRMMYAGLLIKMVLILAATLLYLFMTGGKVSKGGIMGCFGLYVVYTYLEVKILMRLIRNLPKNA